MSRSSAPLTPLASPATVPDLLLPPAVSLRKHARDFVWLLRSEFFILRHGWFWYVVQLALVPVAYLLFLWLLVGRQRPEAMLFAVTGSWVTSISMSTMLTLGQQIGSLKDAHAFEYYATLPISRSVFIAALSTRGVLLALPSLLIVMAVGHFAFGFTVPPAGIAVLVLSAYAMSGAGAWIGFWSPTAQVASMATQVLQTVITLLAPVFVPLEALPVPLQAASLVWPTTHAALALRAAMAGEAVATYWPSLAVLAALAVVSLALVPLKLEWRNS